MAQPELHSTADVNGLMEKVRHACVCLRSHVVTSVAVSAGGCASSRMA